MPVKLTGQCLYKALKMSQTCLTLSYNHLKNMVMLKQHRLAGGVNKSKDSFKRHAHISQDTVYKTSIFSIMKTFNLVCSLGISPPLSL